MINKIWGFLIVIGIIFSIISNKLDILNQEILNSVKTSLDMTWHLFPIMALWLGIMNIAKESGLLNKMTNMLTPFLTIIFPEIPKNHESFGYIASSIIANLFGLGNAATPIGIKAMKSMQDLNKKKDTASRSMITFLIINTTGLTLIPTTIISLRSLYGSNNPTDIIFACILTTIVATISGLIFDRIMAKLKYA